jgi:hypothetical protein
MKAIPCCSRAEAVLLLENCDLQVTGQIFRPLGENYVKIVTFAPQTTTFFQTLDLSFFGVFKTRKKCWMGARVLSAYRDASSVRSNNAVAAEQNTIQSSVDFTDQQSI